MSHFVRPLQAIESYPSDLLINSLVDTATERVARSFSRRLGYLHESKVVREITNKWLSLGGRLGDLTKLSSIEREIFTNIAPVNQQATLDALSRAIKDSKFVSTQNHQRHYFARIARSLAYEPEYFDQAISILIQFALAEPEDFRNDSTRDMLKSLFCCHLSGTNTLAIQRVLIVKKLLESGNIANQKLGLSILNSALEATHFSSHYEFDFGARTRGYGWSPKSQEEACDWFRPFLEITKNYGMNVSGTGHQARMVIARAFRGLWSIGLIDELSSASESLRNIDGFPEGWHAIRKTLHFDKSKLSELSISELKKLEVVMTPKDLQNTIRAKILSSDPYDIEFDDDDANKWSLRMQRATEEAQEVGKIATENHELLKSMIPELLRNVTTNHVINFGIGVGKHSQNIKEIIALIKAEVKIKDLSQLNLSFMRGIIIGWSQADNKATTDFLDEALMDETWAERFPYFQFSLDLDQESHSRLMQSIALGKAPAWQYRSLGYGRATDPLTVHQISTLIDSIALMNMNGLEIAINVLQMVVMV